MSQLERRIISFVLAIIFIFVVADLIIDSREGLTWWHIIMEGAVAVAALVGMFFLYRVSVQTTHQLEKTNSDFAQFRLQAEAWKNESKKYIEGLSKAIDLQLTQWQLSVAEKEVALLLLKGLSLKEIADIRNTTEKTVRVQSTSIYAKSGLAGRSELAAFFLEDLLAPSAESERTNSAVER